MKLIVNSQEKLTDAATVRDLVVELGLGDKAAAVEVNKKIIPRGAQAKAPLNEGDVVEIVTLVGGG